MTLHVDSEVGRLRQAILHRPDLELKRLTPTNHDEYLFDDVLWVKHAKQEHDAFAETLRDLDVEVHLLDQLLRETVAIPEARKYILEESLDERVYGPMALDSLYSCFESLGRRGADSVPDRRDDQAGAARARPRAGVGGRPGTRDGRPAAAAAAEPHVHPGHLRLDLRRGLDQLDAQAGPDPGDDPLRGDLPLAPALRRRAASTSGPKDRPTAWPPPRAATSSSWAGGPCWSG